MELDCHVMYLRLSHADRVGRIDAFLKALDHYCVPPVTVMVGTGFDAYVERLATHAEVWMFQCRDRDVGMLALYANDQRNQKAFISMLGLLPEFQGRGFAMELMDAGFELSRSRGMVSIELEVDATHDRAVRLYQKIGFAVVGKTASCLKMSKEL